jgi:hypothetical protein
MRCVTFAPRSPWPDGGDCEAKLVESGFSLRTAGRQLFLPVSTSRPHVSNRCAAARSNGPLFIASKHTPNDRRPVTGGVAW